VPQATASPHAPVSLKYSVFWYGDDRGRPPGGRSIATRRDGGTHPEARRLVVDFEGEALRRLPADAVLEGLVTVIPSGGSRAELPQPAAILEQQVIRNPVTGGWRLVLQLKPPDDDPVELRAFLRHGANAVSETWSYLLVP
jgi:glucans biosynthesis protein